MKTIAADGLAARSSFSAIDLFAGAGGLGLGLERAGFQIVAANEFEEVFSESYTLNHSNTQVVQGDILNRNVRRRILRAARGVDLVAGGPPCQGFSTVGSKNELDPRNELFYAFLEVVQATKPRAVLFENVSGFKRMYESRAYLALRDGLRAMGYHLPDENCRILNAANFGVPQHRLRTFVVAFRATTRFQFPVPTHVVAEDMFSGKRALTISDALSDLPVVEMGETSSCYASEPKNEYQRLMRNGLHQDHLSEQEAPSHGERLMKVIGHVPTGGTIADVPRHLRPRSYFANTYSRLWWDRPSTTITRNLGTPSSSRCIHPHANRGLTTREGARLQSFPDTYRFVGTRSEKNLQVGNAVPPLLAEAIGRGIVAALTSASIQRVA